jgi:hypothetical protein
MTFDILREITDRDKLVKSLYSGYGRIFLGICIIGSIAFASYSIFGQDFQRLIGERYDTLPLSLKERNISDTEYFLSTLIFYILPANILIVEISALFGFLSSLIHARTFKVYWKIQLLKIRFLKYRTEKYVEDILSIALDASEWTHIRQRAIKVLRLIDLSSSEYIRQLEGLIATNPLLRRELERTIYEQRAREHMREQERVTKDYA